MLKRDFKANQPNQKWATDVTQVKIGDEKIYLSPILDLFNGEVIAYSIFKRPNMRMINEMLNKAFDKVQGTMGLIFHSEQGWQYQHYGYRQTLEKHGIVQSISRKGNCLDNAVVEHFFGIMKTELLYADKFQTSKEFITALKQYIDYYNNERVKKESKWKEPGAIPSSNTRILIYNLVQLFGVTTIKE